MAKILERLKKYVTRKREWKDGLYLGFAIALLFVTFSQQVFSDIKFQDLSKLNEIYYVIDKFYPEDYDNESLKTGMYKGIISNLDGFSSYMTAEEYASFANDDTNKFCGIGIKWQKYDDYYTIIRTYEGGSAAEAGIQNGDIIWGANGKNCQAMTREELRAEIRGEEGTSVDLIVIRDGKELEFTVVRKPITLPYVTLDIYDDVAVLGINSFEGTVVEEFESSLQEVNELGINNLILDLRYNTGGSVELLGTMMQSIVPFDAKIFSLKKKDGSTTNYNLKAHTDKTYNIVILMNDSSASCSEIMAGSLRDLGLAKLVGTNTYGKGVIQDVVVLSDDSVVYLTSGHYYLPNGEVITEDGLTPDEYIEDDVKTIEDEQLDYALKLF